MSSREQILAAIGRNKPGPSALPPIPASNTFNDHLVERFTETLIGVGGQVVPVTGWDEVIQYIEQQYRQPNLATPHRIITTLPELSVVAELEWAGSMTPHELADAELTVIRGHFGVAENGAVWLTESLLGHRAAPFICQHLAIVLDSTELVPTMHEAYERIGKADYGFGLFMAGPSKSADIEQSLVMGAHGPKTMTLFLFT